MLQFTSVFGHFRACVFDCMAIIVDTADASSTRLCCDYLNPQRMRSAANSCWAQRPPGPHRSTREHIYRVIALELVARASQHDRDRFVCFVRAYACAYAMLTFLLNVCEREEWEEGDLWVHEQRVCYSNLHRLLCMQRCCCCCYRRLRRRRCRRCRQHTLNRCM